MSRAGNVSSYAVRRVNPFEGVLQVVETDNARAYSTNGRVWQVQVVAQRPDHTWRSFSHVASIEQFFNFGLWDAESGLRKIPANPVMDIGSMRQAADRLTSELKTLSEQLPFRLIDDYECWAVDDHDAPVALLATTESSAVMRDMRVEHWHATRLPDHSFISKSLLACGIAPEGDLGPRQHAAHLECLIRQSGQHKIWFRRLSDGSGEAVDTTSGSDRRTVDDFPPLGLKTDWQDPQERDLVDDYLAWLAPRLLMLQNITGTQRRELERAARARATELATAYPLIPVIIDRQAVEAARVEAKLRRATL